VEGKLLEPERADARSGTKTHFCITRAPTKETRKYVIIGAGQGHQKNGKKGGI